METANAGGWSYGGGAGATLARVVLARCGARESVSMSDWQPGSDGVQVREIPEGTIAVAMEREWALTFWREGGEVLPIAQGTRAEIELDAREVVLFGLPGGISVDPEHRPWSLHEGSLQATAITTTSRGTYKLMVHPRGWGSLVYVRSDYHVVYLGEDRIDELKATAAERLHRHRGEPLCVRFAGQYLKLHGLGVRSAVAQAELNRGSRLVLVQVGFDRFELVLASSDGECEVVGEYCGADLERGDLGDIRLSGPMRQGDSRTDDGEARPRRAAPHLARGVARKTAAPAAPVRPTEPPRPSTLDRQRLEACLCPEQVPTHGVGRSELANLYAAFRELVEKNLEDMLLWTEELRDLIEAKTSVKFSHGLRTITRALARFLERTGLGRQDGRRFWVYFGSLRRADSDAWATIRERFDPRQQPGSDTASPTALPDAEPQPIPAPSPVIQATPDAAPESPIVRAPSSATPSADRTPTSGTLSPCSSKPVTVPLFERVPPSSPRAAAETPFIGAALNGRAGDLDLPGVATMASGGSGATNAHEGSPGGQSPPCDQGGKWKHWKPNLDRSKYNDAPSQYPGKKKPP